MTTEAPPVAGSGPSADLPAPTGRRLLAALYDAPALFTLSLVLTALLLVINRGEQLAAGPASLALYRACLVLLWVAYYGVSWTRSGQTLGMRIWRLRVRRLDGSPLRWPDVLGRLAASLVAWLPLALGVVAAAWDPERRAWHDRLSRTRVVAVR